ncbi:MAG: helix-turn-helix transcriptional regulator [Nitrospirae bacterium]|nr:helix-turn-helix transcriptional regulator [Nitrospirota bacterium]
MTIGERIKLLRVLSGFTQSEVSRLLNISQHNLSMIESDRYRPRFEQIGILDDLFHCAPYWLMMGKIPAFQVLGYIVVPPKLDFLTSRRKLNEIGDTLRTLLISFLKENEVKKYYLVETNKGESIYIFCLLSDAILLLFVSYNEFISPVQHTVVTTQLRKTKKINITHKLFVDAISDDIDISRDAIKTIFKNLNLDAQKYSNAYYELKKKNTKKEWTFTVTVKVLHSQGLSEEDAYEAIRNMEERYNSLLDKRIHILDVKGVKTKSQ